MKETQKKKEAGKNYQSSFLNDIFNKPSDTIELKIKKWKPKYCGDIDMRIASDGTWFYCGSPIKRKKLVKLFSSILINENNKYFLITPVEKVGIMVDDAPFIANDFEKINENNKSYLVFFTNIDESNTRLNSRQFSDSPLEPNFDIRPVPTKYALFPVVNRRKPVTEERLPYVDYNQGVNFTPAVSRGSVSGYMNGIDTETVLRNQTFAKQRGLGQDMYVPSSSKTRPLPAPCCPSIMEKAQPR